ncbi:MAG: polymer-forming cytoskeletal protein [Nitrospirota bacterium]|nr:polymer-forming cytoskeletal protein [Nitrospirota bacterium]
MFKIWGEKDEGAGVEENKGEHPVKEIKKETEDAAKSDMNRNTILKGSKLVGDIRISCDMELSGDIEGNITAEKGSNIVIKGTCKGNIEAGEGSVDIEGELLDGNISAGKNVKITGMFKGGEVKAMGRISVEGEFSGTLEGNEIEIGPHAKGKGELIYRENISVSKGADIEGQISRLQGELKLVKSSSGAKTAESPVQVSVQDKSIVK